MRSIIVWIGGAALLAATAIDTLAVIGRHVGLPLIGSIELMQGAVLVSASIGIIVATLDGSHARVRLLIDRLRPTARKIADRLSDTLTLIFVLCLLAGSTWLAADLWDAHEQSEMLGVPWALLRLFANICLVVTSAALVARIVRGAKL
ncbi:TRAP transporter small permease [Aurantiacibacter flavus]|uniref:TRAP transporter small permease protein n=1 Tax=Aurantiacibacter flavus TaxID=3145232 RepID=A0ABV0CSI0_9SPHN